MLLVEFAVKISVVKSIVAVVCRTKLCPLVNVRDGDVVVVVIDVG